jgi:hypothetical protein
MMCPSSRPTFTMPVSLVPVVAVPSLSTGRPMTNSSVVSDPFHTGCDGVDDLPIEDANAIRRRVASVYDDTLSTPSC